MMSIRGSEQDIVHTDIYTSPLLSLLMIQSYVYMLKNMSAATVLYLDLFYRVWLNLSKWMSFTLLLGSNFGDNPTG